MVTGSEPTRVITGAVISGAAITLTVLVTWIAALLDESLGGVLE